MPESTAPAASPAATFPSSSILGYPRIGRRRELKKAVEAYWAGRIDAAALEETAKKIQLDTAKHLQALGLTEAAAVPGTFSFYDQVPDAAAHLGAIPARFGQLLDDAGQLDLEGYFTLARGNAGQQPLEMTKWFDSNLHYLVPEIGPETAFSATSNRIVEEFEYALTNGVETRPYLIGPVTFLLLSKPADGAPEGFAPLSRLEDLLPVYVELLGRLAAAGASWIQLDEPALVADQDVPIAELQTAVSRAYDVLTSAPARPAVLVSTPYGSLDELLPTLAASRIEALHLDVFKGAVPDAGELALLAGKTVVAGLVDGHNIWRNDLRAAADKLAQLQCSVSSLAVSTSTSTQHVPHDVEEETQLSASLRSWLAFADQKVTEVVTLAGLLADAAAVEPAIAEASRIIAARAEAEGVRRGDVRERIAVLNSADFRRADYAVRAAVQEAELNLPSLPTTTIGSFPQTSEIRSARARANKGELSQDQYKDRMRDEIQRVVALQEELGFDVLVHGEPERNDMVQYFAENLEGFDVTVHGWVQSYGSRCTRPSILWGDVTRSQPITVEWASYAQSLTAKPMKGMLTGPVTILAWSFVRDDQPLGETANQVALALRDEIEDLQNAGIRIIQVDEPALRELLPLRAVHQAAYLDWSVNSFRLATSGAANGTQVHTHLCYSEFGAVIDAIDGLDADVTSIEAARSRMEVVHDLQSHGFARGVGPGVYDIHSPRVPSQAEVVELLDTAVAHVPVRQLWVNPDCGLKTRGYAETEESLRNLVQAARQVRAQLVQAR
ncbi:5-methyltetrahydropteroyltriglutamate--homocysteine S-methyltransferase [Paenarthrobacter sp. Z7-10]|uniref:5-methyltetrahydropteroyltriglutamate-- homocysteine S-methyltransferase n=1 Tax=Paenarthrobacter sp. Z7-10 TaxID=2787635 RepID=UPI0022A907F9|nr:5-methyltetrahydropteroyltriglutamate--homocysteine S-methyltransferase [Paenarthrobacter sp. Z7-10]MCZ2404379.1 5-methyltetrahydropteroyltriglutamate--homocysteine S-methyltransferase [Paenarthrobacter sp. Z7-10]